MMSVLLFINASQAMFLLAWIVVYLLPLWFLLKKYTQDESGAGAHQASLRGKQPTPTRVQYFAMPLLLEWIDDDSIDASFEQTVIFLRQGRVRIGNSIFERFDEIDHSWNGAHAYRMAGSDRLMIRSASGERFDFLYRHFLWFGFGWIRLVQRTY